MNSLHKIVCFAVLLVMMTSCEKDNDLDIQPPVGLGGEPVERTVIDRWLLDSLTVPYNITVDYRWEPFAQSDLGATLVPPDESKVIAAMSAIKRVWIDVFNAETGSDLFIRK